jgi:hypothetical protein
MTETESNSNAAMGILGINNLSYKLRPDLAVCVSRSIQKQFPQTSTTAPRETMTFILNTGSAYVDFKDSYLSLDVTNTSTVATNEKCWFDSWGGSACNLIERIVISSRSGQIMERIDRANLLAAINLEYTHDLSWREYGTATAAGVARTVEELDWPSVNVVPVGNSTIRFCIPLSMISPFINHTESLMPSQLCSGMRIELLMSSASDAMASSSNATGQVMNYAISNASLNLQSYLLSDVVLRTLNQMSAANGLEIVSSTNYVAVGERSTNTLNLELGKAASRALSCIYAERDKTHPINSTSMKRRPITSTDFVEELQFRIGSLYFPTTSIRGNSDRLTSPELYTQALQSFGKYRQVDNTSSSVSERDFRNGSAVFAQTFERSNVLSLAGQPLSNSRVLALNAQFKNVPLGGVSNAFWLSYVILVRVFASNCVIEM